MDVDVVHLDVQRVIFLSQFRFPSMISPIMHYFSEQRYGRKGRYLFLLIPFFLKSFAMYAWKVKSSIEPEVFASINSTFPYLCFREYRFDSNRVRNKILKLIWLVLDQPLNYARIYLAYLIPTSVKRMKYLDSDLVVVDDIAEPWDANLEEKVLAAPEYCHANFTNYFTDLFWSDLALVRTFEGRRPCYFTTGVMVVTVDKWRVGEYTQKVEEWMLVQKQKRIYHLGSLPPFPLVLAGNIKAVDHQWNQLGLGRDNIEGKCTSLHPRPISLLHWGGKGKPWLRLNSRKPCNVNYLWAPYNLYRSIPPSLEE